MTVKRDIEIQLVKFIDYVYLSNFITNTLVQENQHRLYSTYDNTIINDSLSIDIPNENDWKIFSNRYANISDSNNILYFIKNIKTKSNYSDELLCLTIHIYTKICKKYAHMIENYTCLFASVYIAINKVMCEDYLPYTFMGKVLNINRGIAKKMVWLVDKFIDNEDIYFDSIEKENIIKSIFL